MKAKIEEIIQIEWDMFQHVNNIGGRADCQDDFETFYIMRASQYENWSDDMLCCYYKFLKESESQGRNLVAEKYGRMMQFTDLHYYNKYVAPYIPTVPHKNYILINEIIPILVAWEQNFSLQYPHIAQSGRPLTSEDDASGFTSMETYARGELETYPTQLLTLYAAYIKQLRAEGRSLSVMIQKTMVNLYGYDTIEDAETSLIKGRFEN